MLISGFRDRQLAGDISHKLTQQCLPVSERHRAWMVRILLYCLAKRLVTVKHGSAYTVVRSTSQSYGDSKISGCQNPKTPEPIDNKFGSKVKAKRVNVYSSLPHKGTHVLYGITQCYLPPGRGDISVYTPAN